MPSLMRIPLNRQCPKCNQTLYIDTKNHTVSCNKCGFIEPCHLRGLIPSPKNCRTCIYREGYKPKKTIFKRKMKDLARSIRQIKELSRFFSVTRLPKIPERKDEQKKWKVICTQAWSDYRRKSYNPEEDNLIISEEEDLDEEIEIQYSDEDAEED